MSNIILFIFSIIPAILIGLFVYKKDKNKESTKLLLKLFLGGVASIFITLILDGILSTTIPFLSIDIENVKELNIIQSIIYAFIGIALVEETSKWIMLYTISYNNKEFDEFYDMIIYAVFVALGFATLENILYVFQNGLAVAILRCILSVPSHACDGVLMGYYLGLAKIAKLNNNIPLSRKNIILSILIPTISHGIFDYFILSGSIYLLILFLAFVIFIYINSYKKIKKISSLNGKIKYKNNYCINCGTKVNSDYCPICGNKNE